ncbi:PREDICTED: centrosomal protein kizuna [Tauraco erythrolophus]|uniref:centrosomal protein kizuna n=1 Tax=Tauraco erythrolophus TaxID=121530 RepID=UPI000523EE37|nr:PREDICTED: centrosomal protein kizuna [Tauraco erythrolophus]
MLLGAPAHVFPVALVLAGLPCDQMSKQAWLKTKLKYMKLKKYLKEVDERRKRALLRNQALLKEFAQFEAYMKTLGSEMIQKMEAWRGREIKSVLSLGEGNLSAEGDKGAGSDEQMPWAGRQTGISTGTAMPRGLYHPATVLMGCHTPAVLADGDLGVWQKPPEPTESCTAPGSPSCSPSLEGLGPESRSADVESDASVEGAGRGRGLAASEEGSKQLTSSASDPEAAASEEERPRGSVPADGGERGRDAHATEGSLLQPPDPPAVPEEPSVSSAPDGCHGMLPGLSRALQLTEDAVMRTSPRHRALYQGEHTGTVGTAELLSFCNRAGSLKEDDLEACQAVILHQLRALSRSTWNGSLRPEKALDAGGRAAGEEQTRPDQQWDTDMLQTYLTNHALFLKKHRVQLTEEVAEMFESLLVSGRKARDSQALPVSREVLPEERGDRSSAESIDSSCSSPSIPREGREVQQAKHAAPLAGTGEQEVTSGREDESREESAVEKIPITGWDVGDESCQAKEHQETRSETSSSWNERSPPSSRAETKKRMVTAIKSKAFWGESDDSSSEIEAALRPQTHSTEADDFDDFYH